jgi:hypothetical protein
MTGFDRRRLAIVLWAAWAAVVWNVVFDHTVEVAGRAYLHAAAIAARDGRYERIDDWMRPAVTTGLWRASAAALLILGTGIAGIRIASRRSSRHERHTSEAAPRASERADAPARRR